MGSYYIGAMCWYAKNDIQHYGVKGQKRGVRQWQNKDGSLTPEGRIHYGVGPAREKKTVDAGVDYVKTRMDSDKNAFDDFHKYASEYAKKALGEGASQKQIDEFTDKIAKNAAIDKFEKQLNTTYEEARKDTDFSNLPKKEKAKKELELMKSWQEVISGDGYVDIDAINHLLMRIVCESGSPNAGAVSVSSSFDKAYKEVEDEFSGLYKIKDNKEFMKRYNEEVNAIKNRIMPVILNDIGYEDSEEARDALYNLVYYD